MLGCVRGASQPHVLQGEDRDAMIRSWLEGLQVYTGNAYEEDVQQCSRPAFARLGRARRGARRCWKLVQRGDAGIP